MPRSAAISWVTSTGKPKVSWSLKATSPGTSAGSLGEGLLEQRDAAGEGGAEAALLALDDAEHEVAVGGEVGVGVAHRVDARRDEAREGGVLHAEEVGEAHGPADEAAQHVAAVLVARDDAVVHEEAHRAGVVGQHAQGVVVLGRLAVGAAGDRLGGVEERPHDVGVDHRCGRPGGA